MEWYPMDRVVTCSSMKEVLFLNQLKWIGTALKDKLQDLDSQIYSSLLFFELVEANNVEGWSIQSVLFCNNILVNLSVRMIWITFSKSLCELFNFTKYEFDWLEVSLSTGNVKTCLRLGTIDCSKHHVLQVLFQLFNFILWFPFNELAPFLFL